MLSRLVRPTFSSLNQVIFFRPIATSPALNGGISTGDHPDLQSLTFIQPKPTKWKEGPERDLVNFPRPKRLLHPPKTILGFIPESWFKFFYPKTGVTGPYLFTTGLTVYVLSKEIWVIEHEFMNGIALFMMLAFAIKKFGPSVAAFLDKEIEKESQDLNNWKDSEIKNATDSIDLEKKSQWQAEGQSMLFDVKRENVALQVEAVFRERQMEVFNQVKKRLDYQVEKQNVERNMEQKHMVSWIVDKVQKAITPEQENENMKKCIADLKFLATKV